MPYYLGDRLYHEKFWYLATDFFFTFFSKYKWLPKEIAIQIMTEFLIRIILWLVPHSVGWNGLWGLSMTRQGPRWLPCLPLDPALKHSQLRASDTSHTPCSFVYTYILCSPAFSGAWPRWFQHVKVDRSSMNWSRNSIDEEMLCIAGDTWATFVSVRVSGVWGPFWRCSSNFTGSGKRRSK